MARMGQFAGPNEQYGLPLSYIHPRDNDMAKAKFHPVLLDPRWKLTYKQKREMQAEIDDLTKSLQYGREKAGGNRGTR